MYVALYPDIQKRIQKELGESTNLLPPGPKPLWPGLTPTRSLLSTSRRPDHRPGEETEAVGPGHAALHRSLYPGDVQALLLPALHHPAQVWAGAAGTLFGGFFGVFFWEVPFRQITAWESIPAMGKYAGAQPELLVLKLPMAFMLANSAGACGCVCCPRGRQLPGSLPSWG